MHNDWITKAVLFEMLSVAFLYPNKETIVALSDGEFGEVLSNSLHALNLESKEASATLVELGIYKDKNADETLHRLRIEHTRLFIGSPRAQVSPYAGIWYAEDRGVDPLLFVNKESMAVERFMASCGVNRPSGTNEPLDHIGTELEFLNYLSLDRAGALDEGGRMKAPSDAYERFYGEHFNVWSKRFASAVKENSTEPILICAATVLAALPEDPL